MYFANFPRINFKVSGNRFKEAGRFAYAVDITAGARLFRSAVTNLAQFDTYLVKDLETPEVVAEVLWGQPEWHWILLLLNEVFHPADWVLSSSDFEDMIVRKYGSLENAKKRIAVYVNSDNEVQLPPPRPGGVNAFMQYSDAIGFSFVVWANAAGAEVDQPALEAPAPGLRAYNYYDYETLLNERKRTIKVVSKQVAEQIVDEYVSTMAASA